MKFNWGVGVFVGYGLFVVFILFLVYKSTQTKVDLVAEDYYQQELQFQDVINKKQRYVNLDSGLVFSVDKGQLTLTFPPQHQNPKGTVVVYRPANKSYDRQFEIKTLNRQMEVEIKNAPVGLYKLIVDWKSGSEAYFFEEDVYLRP